ncbi:MAG: methyltransferase domain-containing protein [Arenicellales bacterium]
MSNDTHQEYDDGLVAVLEAVWGEGFMSPGGTDEVDRYLHGIDLTGLSVLDIGCGLGGVDIHLVSQHQASKVTGIDIESELIPRCERLAQKYNAVEQTLFLCVEPGALPFANASFDMVTSKDSIIHIADKHALAADIYRLLKPGGCFAASDWLAGYEGKPSAEMREYLAAEALDFGLASADGYRHALSEAGFIDIEIVDRNDWYRTEARRERDQMRGALYDGLVSQVGSEFMEHEIDVWEKMIIALDQGQLRPTHLRGRKPG